METITIAYLGAALLGLATLPQAVSLLRERRVSEFGWTFSLFNFLGLSMLAWRSLAIQEWAFLSINLVTTTFWGMVVVIKVQQRFRRPRTKGLSMTTLATSAPLEVSGERTFKP